MKSVTILMLSWLLMANIGNTQPTMENEPMLLTNIRIFDVHSGTFSPPMNIKIEGETISYVAIVFDGPVEGREIDCRGKFAVPGLFECHAHLTGLTLSDNYLKKILAEFVSRGVTQIRDVGGPIDLMSGMKKRISSGEIIGPEIFYAGPMLEKSPMMWSGVNNTFPGFTVAIDDTDDVDSILPLLAEQGASLVKTFNKIDSTVYEHLVQVSGQLSLKIVHDPGTPLYHWIPVDRAIDLGVTSIEHAKAPWPVVLKDEFRQEHDSLAGLDVDPEARRAFQARMSELGTESIAMDRLKQLARKMNENGVYLCPTLYVLSSMEEMALQSKRRDMQVDELPDSVANIIKEAAAGIRAVSCFFVSGLARDSVKMLVGQDSQVPSATFTEMRLMQECGVSEVEIIRGATLYPATWLGVDDRLGSIEPGKQANILVLDANPLEDIQNMEATFLVVNKGNVVAD